MNVVPSHRVSLSRDDLEWLVAFAMILGIVYYLGGWRTTVEIGATAAFWYGLVLLHDPFPDVDSDELTRSGRLKWYVAPLLLAFLAGGSLRQYGVFPTDVWLDGLVTGLIWWTTLLGIERVS